MAPKGFIRKMKEYVRLHKYVMEKCKKNYLNEYIVAFLNTQAIVYRFHQASTQ